MEINELRNRHKQFTINNPSSRKLKMGMKFSYMDAHYELMSVAKETATVTEWNVQIYLPKNFRGAIKKTVMTEENLLVLKNEGEMQRVSAGLNSIGILHGIGRGRPMRRQVIADPRVS